MIILLVSWGIQPINGQEQTNSLFEKGEILTFGECISRLESQFDLKIIYSGNSLRASQTIEFNEMTSDSLVLVHYLAQQLGFEVVRKDNRFILLGNFLRQEENNGPFRLSGFVKDGRSMELLVGASILFPGINKGTISNEHGFFSMEIPDSPHDSLIVVFSYVGYEPITLKIDLDSPLQSDFLLLPDASIEEVIITGGLIQAKMPDGGMLAASGDVRNFIPGNLGWSDLLNELTLLPGINKGNDFQTGVSIRGLDPSNSQILLDGFPVYGPNHLFGLKSVIDHSQLNNVQLFKNIVPPEYSGRLSGVINNQLKSGNAFERKVSFGIDQNSILASFEGPVFNNRSSFYVGGRQSHQQLYLPALAKSLTNIDNLSTNFNDLSIKLSHNLSPTNSFEMLIFWSDDKHEFKLNSQQAELKHRYGWSNLLLGLRWKGVIGSRISHSLQIGLVRYQNNKRVTISGAPGIEEGFYYDQFAQAKLSDVMLRQKLDYYINDNFQFRFGFNIVQHNTRPALYRAVVSTIPADDLVIETVTDSISNDIDCFSGINWAITDKIALSAGVSMNYFKPIYRDYTLDLNPFLTLNKQFEEVGLLSFHIQRTKQNIHLLEGPQIGLVSDLWIQSNAQIPSQNMWQCSAVFSTGRFQNFHFDFEIYRRWLDHLIGFESIAEQYDPGFGDGTVIPVFTDLANWEDRIQQITGDAYGIETSLNYTSGRFNASISYALAYTIFKIASEESSFPANSDYRHSGHVYGQYMISPKLNSYFSWQYHSGGPYTLPLDGHYIEEGNWIPGFSQRNDQRFNSYHLANIGLNYNGKVLTQAFELDFGFRNLYNHKNPLFVYLSASDQKLEIRQVSGLPIYPFFKFKLLLQKKTG